MSEERKGSLELNWINKDKSLLYEYDEDGEPVRPKKWVDKDDLRVAEPRNLKLVDIYGMNPIEKFNEKSIDNKLIRGDNLLVLRSLVEEFKERDPENKVKCVYIDPPYNIGRAFKDYHDNFEHSEWLSMMKDRLELIKKLMRKDGIICVQIDDREAHHLKCLMDEVFGNQNFLAPIYVQTVYPDKTLKQDRIFHDIIEQILVYSKNKELCKVYQDFEEYSFDKYKYYINEIDETDKVVELGGKKVEIFTKDSYEIKEDTPSKEGLKEIWASGTILDINSSGRFFRDHLSERVEDDGLGALYKVYGIGQDSFDYRYFTGPKRKGATKGKYYQGVPKKVLQDPKEAGKKISIKTYWDMAAEFGNCRHEGGVELKSGKKPEKLLYKLLDYFSEEGDLVLDSFLGSGTTAAVAHKMNRKWIGVELLPNQIEKSIDRLRFVIDSQKPDRTGISEKVKWQGGGQFAFYEIGGSILEKKGKMNWSLAEEDIVKSIFWMYDYKFKEELNYDDLTFYIGKKKNKFAISIISQDIEIIRKEELDNILDLFKEEYGPNKEIEIYTNYGVGVDEKDLPNSLTIRKVPDCILEKYKLGEE